MPTLTSFKEYRTFSIRLEIVVLESLSSDENSLDLDCICGVRYIRAEPAEKTRVLSEICHFLHLVMCSLFSL